MAKQPAVVLLTVDPTSPNQTVIGYNASFEVPDFVPIGFPGGDVLAALFQGGFEVEEIVSGDTYIQYYLTNKKFKPKEVQRLIAAYAALQMEPVT